MATTATQVPPDRHTKGGGGAANNNGGEISITLASPDETAKVRIAVANPDLVAEKVVSQLAKSFPPESVMTITANDDDLSSAADTTTGATDPESRPTTNRSGAAARSSSRRRKSPVKNGNRAGYKTRSRGTSSRQLEDIEEEDDEDMRAPQRGGGGRRARRHCRRHSSCSRDGDFSEEDSSRSERDDEEDSMIEDLSGPGTRRNRPRIGATSPPRVALTQEYFSPQQLDYAIPITPGQASVKLINDRRIRIERNRCFSVDHDYRGLPAGWYGVDGRRREWAPSHYPGVGVKYQDYVVDNDLVYAVPITPGQREVSISDGGTLRIAPENIIRVFYDGDGRSIFTDDRRKRKRRIRPGLAELPGIANHVRYYMLLDCNDGTGEQFVIPFTGFQTHVPNPYGSGGKTIPVDRNNITVVFYDTHRQPLYTQLADGSLIAGGLSGAPPPTFNPRGGAGDASTTSFDESEYISTHSESGGPMPRVRLHGDRMEITNYHQLSGVGGPRGHGLQSRTAGPKSSRQRSHREAAGHARLDSNTSDAVVEQSISSSTRRRQEIIERRVPVQQVQFVEKIVEVPEVHFVEKHVEVEKIEYETKIVKKKQVVERPVEHIKYVPKIETKIVERIIEVPEIIEVLRPEIIEKKVPVDRYVDDKRDVIVSHKLTPNIREGSLLQEVECLRLEPQLISVDVYVPKIVRNQLLSYGISKTQTNEIDISISHYNSLILKYNNSISYDKLPFVKTSNGSFPLLTTDTEITCHQPTEQEIFALLKNTGLVGGSAMD